MINTSTMKILKTKNVVWGAAAATLGWIALLNYQGSPGLFPQVWLVAGVTPTPRVSDLNPQAILPSNRYTDRNYFGSVF